MRLAAIFDLDNTLVIGSTGTSVVSYMWKEGLLTRYMRPARIARLMAAAIGYKLNLVDITRFMETATRVVEGVPLEEMWALVNKWFHERVQDELAPGALTRMQWHREQGHRIVICTASGQFSAMPIARYLGVVDTVYTEWHERDGRMAGTVQLPINYGAGKVFWLRQWAEKNGVDIEHSWFYSDHESDLPLFNLVAHPMAVNPYPKLEAIAKARGWPVEHWYEPK